MPKIGALTKTRIILTALLVAVLTSFWLLEYLLDNWLRSKAVESLESFLHWAIWIVLLGVIIEEWEIIEGGAKFARYIWHGRFRDAVKKALEKEHKKKLIEGAGFAILVIGLAAELRLGPIIDVRHRDELVAQGPREALIRGAIHRRLVDLLKPFAGQKIDVRFSSVTFSTSGGDWGSVPYGDDILGLSQTFIGILKDAMWNSPETPLPSNLRGRGLRIEVVRSAPQKTWRAAKALAVALQKVPLLVEGPNLIDEKEAKRVTNKVVLPELGSDTIILVVLTHP